MIITRLRGPGVSIPRRASRRSSVSELAVVIDASPTPTCPQHRAGAVVTRVSGGSMALQVTYAQPERHRARRHGPIGSANAYTPAPHSSTHPEGWRDMAL